MVKNFKYTLLALAAALIMSTFTMLLFYHLDAVIGEGNAQVLQLSGGSVEKKVNSWYFGFIPRLEILPKNAALAEGRAIWAQPGDYAGAPVMGITFAFTILMWFIWIGFYLGFPANMSNVAQKLLVLLATAGLSIGANLIFARMTADISTGGTILGNAFHHLSLGVTMGGIWFIALLSRLGVGITATKPVLPLVYRKNEKFNALIGGLCLAIFIEWILYKSGLTLEHIAVDFAVWAIAVVIFLAYFGYRPSMWTKGERPAGLIITVLGTIGSVLLWIALQKLSGGILGAGIASEEFGNRGFSLMISSWLVVWMQIVHHAGKCSPVKMR